MEKIYKTEKEGQIAFFDNYNVPWQENDGVLVENCDGIYKATKTASCSSPSFRSRE